MPYFGVKTGMEGTRGDLIFMSGEVNHDPARLFKMNHHNPGDKESRLYNTLKFKPRYHPNLQIRHTFFTQRVVRPCNSLPEYFVSSVKLFLTSKQTMIRWKDLLYNSSKSYGNTIIYKNYNILLYTTTLYIYTKAKALKMQVQKCTPTYYYTGLKLHGEFTWRVQCWGNSP